MEDKIIKKKLAHIQAYEELHNMITDGTFVVGAKLPPEPQLAKMLKISRMTLRKALALLNDDGYLQRIQGSGNYVSDKGQSRISGLEKIGNPVYKVCKEQITEVTREFCVEVASDYAKEILHVETPAVVSFHTWYRSEERLVAYTYGMMAIETVTEYKLDLNNEAQVYEFLGEELYHIAKRVQLQIMPVSVGSTTIEAFAMETKPVTMIQEKVYQSDLKPIVCNKIYILAKDTQCVIEITDKK